MRFQRPATITQDDLSATADFFQVTDWNVLSVATVMILAWEKIGQRDPENGYRYPCCQHSKSLKKFFQHFETIVSDVHGENIPDADVIKLFNRTLKWYPDLGKNWLIDLFSPFVCGEDVEGGDDKGGQ
jgi:hypothetical protein